jgi:hypothetical protein
MLRVVESIAIRLLSLLRVIPLFWNDMFGSTDMWGRPRDRVKERQDAKDWVQYGKAEEYWKPKPLDSPRRRRSSLLLEPVRAKRQSWWSWKADEVPQQSFDQLQSPLGRLPEELRELIYAYLVPKQRLHVQESYKRFGFVKCASNNSLEVTTTCDQVFGCLEPHLNTATGRFNSLPSLGSRLDLSSYEEFKIKPKLMEGRNDIRCPRSEMLALAKTCRLLYTCYISSLYSLPIFAFTSLKQLQTFSTTIPLHHLNTVTSLQFSSEIGSYSNDRLDVAWEEIQNSQWKSAWEVIASMHRLRDLRVDLRMRKLSTSSAGDHKWMEERIFGPMKGVEQTIKFDVWVNWMESRGFVLGEVPFTLERDLERPAWSDRVRV